MDKSRRFLLQGAGVGLVAAAMEPAAVHAANGAKPMHQASQKQLPKNKPLLIVNFDLLEQEAKKVMSEAAYAYIGHAAGDEWTYRENRRACNDFSIRTHRLAGVLAKSINLETDLLGHRLPFSIMVAPMGAQIFASPIPELAAAGGAGMAELCINRPGHQTGRWKRLRRQQQGLNGSSFTTMPMKKLRRAFWTEPVTLATALSFSRRTPWVQAPATSSFDLADRFPASSPWQSRPALRWHR